MESTFPQSSMDASQIKKKGTSIDPLKKQGTSIFNKVNPSGLVNYDEKQSGFLSKNATSMIPNMKSQGINIHDSLSADKSNNNKLLKLSQMNSNINLNSGSMQKGVSTMGINANQSNNRQKSNEKMGETVKKKAELTKKDLIKRVILEDSEDRWFLNPQYKLEIKYGSNILITLMQEDEVIMNKQYQKCNFVVMLAQVNNNLNIFKILYLPYLT